MSPLKAYETSTFDTTAFVAAFPASYVAPSGKGKKGAVSASGPVDISLFAPVVLVTAAWALLYYAFLWDQSATAFVVLKDARRKAKAEGKPPPSLADVKYGRYSKSARVRAADRTVGNYLDEPGVLVNLWLRAHAFVSPVNAAAFGWAWLSGSRLVYPWAMPPQVPRRLPQHHARVRVRRVPAGRGGAMRAQDVSIEREKQQRPRARSGPRRRRSAGAVAREPLSFMIIIRAASTTV